MTKLERTVSLIVSCIVALSLAISVAFSIAFGSAQNDDTFEKVVDIGMNVFDSQMNDAITMLHMKSDLMSSDSRTASAVKEGNTNVLREIFLDADIDGGAYCLFISEDGIPLWMSADYSLAKYDVSAALDEDKTLSGFYADEKVPLSAVYIVPVHDKADGSRIVGAMLLGYELSDVSSLEKLKESTGCDFAFYSISGGRSKAAVSTIDTGGEPDEMPQKVTEAVTQRDSINEDVTVAGQKYMAQYEAVTDIYGRVIGAVFAGMSSAPKENAKTFMVTCSVGVAALIIPLAFCLVMLMLRKIAIDPIVEAGMQVQGMNKGDLSVPDVDSSRLPKNEIGDFTRRLQETKHTLSAYIQDISRVLDGMADGDFTRSADLRYMGDFTRIQESFERIRDRLSGIVSEIDRSSEAVYIGSEQMAAGSQVLADGTVTQAAAMEELSGKISSVLEKTKQNAGNAFRASELSRSVEESSSRQNEAMKQLTEAMEDIARRSADIAGIIETIDNIAFQTNILALNAAVEAARAGAAGKGFAVVADEVRNLASKSADAAKETNELITATTEAVSAGCDLVESVTSSMGEITRRAEETSRLVNAISNDSANQASDIDMINDALGRISDVISQNSATAQESAASCQQLATRSRTLKDQVKVLKA
ncbi:MAG: cache domain-containing protein [Oscillospiraceae bacterium]|nr:cache domain-containing protein [Oscillospiraceae bacterium]